MDIIRIARQLLTELDAHEFKIHLETLNEMLEIKNDPNPEEIILASSIYEFIEKYAMLESSLKSYVQKSNRQPSRKLTELLEKISYDGNGKFLD